MDARHARMMSAQHAMPTIIWSVANVLHAPMANSHLKDQVLKAPVSLVPKSMAVANVHLAQQPAQNARPTFT